jgi:signal transduction histidine kinase
MRILIIEDNPDHALFTKRVLKKTHPDYELDLAVEAKEALKKASEKNYDLILCDYRLPDLSALDILKKIRENGSDIPFIAVTSSGSEKIAVELMKEGAYDYVVKDSSYENALPVVIERARDRYNVKKEKERLEEELKKSNKKLQEMYEIKSSFTSMVSHELRTPLTAIKEGIAIVLDGATGSLNGQQKEFLEIARKNVDRLKRLIDDVLDFSKLESKKMEFKMSEGDINGIVKEIAESQRMVAQEKGLYLNIELGQDIPRIEFDHDRIAQVLDNLLSNSIKFTGAGGVTVSTASRENGSLIEVCVRDTGEGIRQEDIPKLFQKFQQLNSAGQRKTGGTGLGLAISKEIVEHHKGKIWIESEYGKGSAFKFTVPMRKKEKVLVIDDDRVILDVCKRLLGEDEYTVVCALTGEEGLLLAKRKSPALIILDMRLSDISGLVVIERLKNNKETADIPILVMSGYLDEIDKLKKEPAKTILSWIAKPFGKDDFMPKINALLGRRG